MRDNKKDVTAIQEIIDIISENPNEYISRQDTLRLLEVIAKPKFREQIEKAYTNGCAEWSGFSDEKESQKYYEENYTS